MSNLDKIIIGFDQALRASTGNVNHSKRKNPADVENTNIAPIAIDDQLNQEEKQLAGRLMRVNHCGEVCAQALYNGQALTAKTGRVTNAMLKAAEEETDHLVWCEERLKELDTSTSKLNPLWYASSFSMGALTGLLGDKINLGFVAATEEQVCKHLDEHLERLPNSDHKSRAILESMRDDEKQHEQAALSQGGARFPSPVKSLMTGVSSLMTKTSYWF